MAINAVFNGTSLQTASYITNRIDHASAPSRTVNRVGLARVDGSRITNVNYTEKKIVIEGIVTGTSIANLESLCDSLNAAVLGQNGYLDVDYNASTRRYVATNTNLMITREKRLTSALFSAEFVCVAPFGTDTVSSTLLAATTLTTASSSTPLTVGGSAPQVPIITLTLGSLTGATGASVTLTEPVSGQGITVTRTWANGDVLAIDCGAKTVLVNGAVVAFSGMFPTWPPGAQNLNYTDTFTGRSNSVLMTYLKRYL